MADELSKKQRLIFEYIKEEALHRGYPPSVREICDAVGLKSTSTVHGHLARLEKKGYIRRDPSKPRAIEITDPSFCSSASPDQEMINIPIIGRVAAGSPLLAVENIEGHFALPLNYLSITNAELFMVEVKGDSMIKMGVYEGDYLVVAQQNQAVDNDVVVALIEDSVTVKRYFKEDDYIRLQPENDDYEPIFVRDVRILGKVIALYRIF